ncbi:MAG: multiheme c-type cytochrome [Paludibaculum sp.]
MGGSWQESADWVGPSYLWKDSMMAHAAQDPYWRAKVAYETSLAPAESTEIEDKCLRCHAPADEYPKRVRGEQLRLTGLTESGREGVTCTVCHQIERTGLGRAESFTGSFQLGTKDRVYGPFADPFVMPMLHHTGYTATEAVHVQEAAFCGTCHTVITHPRGGTGEFVEQAPFLEWLASEYPQRGTTCQNCHMPALEAAQYIAHRPPGGAFPPTSPRAPFAQHLFAGGNALVPGLLGNREMESRARQQLSRALKLEVNARLADDGVRVEVVVTNLTGHKLPTAFPSRQLWIHLRVKNDEGQVVFESGDWDRDSGELVRGAELAVFEAEYSDGKGRPTVSLLEAAHYRKDTRIPPSGFRTSRLAEAGLQRFDISPVAVPGNMTLQPGSALIRYKLRLGGPLQVEAEALFRTIRPDHLLPAVPIPAGLRKPVLLARATTALR